MSTHVLFIDFLDVGYKHNNRPMEMFRAIRVTRPVRELSGNFTCNVVENKKEDSPAGEYLEQIASHEILVYGKCQSLNVICYIQDGCSTDLCFQQLAGLKNINVL